MGVFVPYPSLFDGDDAIRGLVDRSAWRIEDGRLMPGPSDLS